MIESLPNKTIEAKDRTIRLFVSRGVQKDVGKYATLASLKSGELAKIMMVVRVLHGKIYDVLDYEMRGPKRIQNGALKSFFKSMWPGYDTNVLPLTSFRVHYCNMPPSIARFFARWNSAPPGKPLRGGRRLSSSCIAFLLAWRRFIIREYAF